VINRKKQSTDTLIQEEERSFNYIKPTIEIRYLKYRSSLRPSEVDFSKVSRIFWTQVRDKVVRSRRDREISLLNTVATRKQSEPGSLLLQEFVSVPFNVTFCSFVASHLHLQLHYPVCKPPTFPIWALLFSSDCPSACHTPKESVQCIICSSPHSLTLLWRCSLLLIRILVRVLDQSSTRLGKKSPSLDARTGMLLS